MGFVAHAVVFEAVHYTFTIVSWFVPHPIDLGMAFFVLSFNGVNLLHLGPRRVGQTKALVFFGVVANHLLLYFVEVAVFSSFESSKVALVVVLWTNSKLAEF